MSKRIYFKNGTKIRVSTKEANVISDYIMGMTGMTGSIENKYVKTDIDGALLGLYRVAEITSIR